MWKILKTRWNQGFRTIPFPPPKPMPSLFGGRPVVDPSQCRDSCQECKQACPTNALSIQPLTLDLGRCLFCGLCETQCSTGAIRFTREFSLAARKRDQLLVKGKEWERAEALSHDLVRLYGRSFRLREVSAGGCSGCDLELQAIGNVEFDSTRFGIQVVASPRHADGLLVTGPVSRNMELALQKTYEALPDPRIVIAVGACAIQGGAFEGSPEVRNGVDAVLPVDLYIPGCPPHPWTILDGLLSLLNRVPPHKKKGAA
jgi:Ni,Fe-hydrogenase III small subunit/NAD-dependent dihydropyrimidine dehydrogenase PreA subunit